MEMKAARMYGVRDIRIENIPVPKIGEGDILLKVRAASVCGTDIRMYQNGYGGIDQKNPRILGHEIAGEIVEVGQKVNDYKIGQRITVAPNMGCGLCDRCIEGNSHLCPDYKALGIQIDGGFAEYCLIPEAAVKSGNVFVLKDSISFEEAAVNEPLSCAFNGSERCEIRPGDTVLIIGAGPIGLMHAKLAKLSGAGRVFLNDLNQDRLSAVKKVDCDIITIEGDPKEEVFKQTKDGVDVCIIACPSPAAQSMAPGLCTYNARVLFFGGVPQSKQPVAIDTNIIHYKQLKISGTTRASLRQFKKTLSFMEEGIIDLRGIITGRYSIEKIEDAINAASSAEGLKNVIVF